MSIAVKICGLSTAPTLAAAIEHGARMVGFVFYRRSPRFVTAQQARLLARFVPKGVETVGLFVDADDTEIARTLDLVPLDLLQLHGQENPERAATIRERFRRPVMKALKVAGSEDIARSHLFFGQADRILFDAAPASPDALPGGNGMSFDWSLLRGRELPLPWMLSGGLTPANLAEAVRQSGARALDVSSGVESSPGIKDSGLIRAFLERAAEIS
jgi:phosphoribosylanthranilate isomerase